MAPKTSIVVRQPQPASVTASRAGQISTLVLCSAALTAVGVGLVVGGALTSGAGCLSAKAGRAFGVVGVPWAEAGRRMGENGFAALETAGIAVADIRRA